MSFYVLMLTRNLSLVTHTHVFDTVAPCSLVDTHIGPSRGHRSAPAYSHRCGHSLPRRTPQGILGDTPSNQLRSGLRICGEFLRVCLKRVFVRTVLAGVAVVSRGAAAGAAKTVACCVVEARTLLCATEAVFTLRTGCTHRHSASFHT